jgi:hypothetical protein
MFGGRHHRFRAEMDSLQAWGKNISRIWVFQQFIAAFWERRAFPGRIFTTDKPGWARMGQRQALLIRTTMTKVFVFPTRNWHHRNTDQEKNLLPADHAD